MKAYIESYQPGGAHNDYDHRRGTFVTGTNHRDWRYRIVTKSGLPIYHRAGFCYWERALASLQEAWPRVTGMMELTDPR